MVNNVRIIPFSPPPDPFPVGEARKFAGPVFDLVSVQLAITGDLIYPVTDKAERDLDNLKWNADDVASVIRALLPSDYKNSEWCEARNGLKFDADAYAIPYDEVNEMRNIRDVRYYIKFGFQKNKLVLALISCHV
jgi:hypothetical protein